MLHAGRLAQNEKGCDTWGAVQAEGADKPVLNDRHRSRCWWQGGCDHRRRRGGRHGRQHRGRHRRRHWRRGRNHSNSRCRRWGRCSHWQRREPGCRRGRSRRGFRSWRRRGDIDLRRRGWRRLSSTYMTGWHQSASSSHWVLLHWDLSGYATGMFVRGKATWGDRLRGRCNAWGQQDRQLGRRRRCRRAARRLPLQHRQLRGRCRGQGRQW